MSLDETLRALERAARASGAPDDVGQYLLARLRAGELERARLVLAARLGHPGAEVAARALGEAIRPLDPDEEPERWAGALWRGGGALAQNHAFLGMLELWRPFAEEDGLGWIALHLARDEGDLRGRGIGRLDTLVVGPWGELLLRLVADGLNPRLEVASDPGSGGPPPFALHTRDGRLRARLDVGTRSIDADDLLRAIAARVVPWALGEPRR